MVDITSCTAALHLCLLAWAMQWVVDIPEIVNKAVKINREKVQRIANKKKQDEIVNEIYCKFIQA